MKRFILTAVLLTAMTAFAQAPTYTRQVIAGRQGDTISGACVIKRNGVEVTRTSFGYVRDVVGGETFPQLRTRILAPEQARCRAALEQVQANDAATATDESANLAAIAQ